MNDRDQYEVTPLHNAAKEGLWQVAELLLQSGAKVNERDFRGKTPVDSITERIFYRLSDEEVDAITDVLVANGGKVGKD